MKLPGACFSGISYTFSAVMEENVREQPEWN